MALEVQNRSQQKLTEFKLALRFISGGLGCQLSSELCEVSVYAILFEHGRNENFFKVPHNEKNL